MRSRGAPESRWRGWLKRGGDLGSEALAQVHDRTLQRCIPGKALRTSCREERRVPFPLHASIWDAPSRRENSANASEELAPRPLVQGSTVGS